MAKIRVPRGQIINIGGLGFLGTGLSKAACSSPSKEANEARVSSGNS